MIRVGSIIKIVANHERCGLSHPFAIGHEYKVISVHEYNGMKIYFIEDYDFTELEWYFDFVYADECVAVVNLKDEWYNQRTREVHEAYRFLREHNHSIPDETLEIIKTASLKELERMYNDESV